MVFCIKQFSSALCLAKATHLEGSKGPRECFRLTENSHRVEDIIVYQLSEIYIPEFGLISDYLSSLDIRDPAKYMKASLARYVKLTKDPSYFNFILLSSLIHYVGEDTFRKKQCYTYAKVNSLCLELLYDRYFKDGFQEKERKGSESLGAYCKRIDRSIISKKEKNPLPIDVHKEIKSLFEIMNDVEDDYFTLTDTEEKLLNDAMDLLPQVNISSVPEVPLIESPELSPIETDSDENISYEPGPSSVSVKSLSESSSSSDHVVDELIKKQYRTDDEKTKSSETSSASDHVVDELIKKQYRTDNEKTKLSESELIRRQCKIDPSRLEKVCQYCSRKCCKFVEYFIAEIKYGLQSVDSD